LRIFVLITTLFLGRFFILLSKLSLIIFKIVAILVLRAYNYFVYLQIIKKLETDGFPSYFLIYFDVYSRKLL